MEFNNPKTGLIFLITCVLGCQNIPQGIKPATETIKVTQNGSPKPQSLAQQALTSNNQYLSRSVVISTAAKAEFERAVALLANNELSLAKSAFESLSRTVPLLSGPWLKLGDIAVKRQQPDIAIALYQTALDKNKHNYFARNRLALLYRQQGLFKKAENEYQQALASWPGFNIARLNLGILYDLYLGHKPEALEQYRLYQKLNTLQGHKLNKQVKGWVADLSRQVANQAVKSEEQDNG